MEEPAEAPSQSSAVSPLPTNAVSGRVVGRSGQARQEVVQPDVVGVAVGAA